jgi:hypothetical protein
VRDVILNNAVSALCGGFVTVITLALSGAFRHFKSEKAEQKSMREAMLALLHDRIYQAGHYYCEQQKWCSLEDKRNIEYLYKPYAAMGGNGTGEQAYKAIQALPTEPPEN